MADPLSVAGLALSVASLTFELFSGCIKAYKLILEARDMPETCRHLLIRLQMEKEKLIGWAVLANVSETEESLDPTLRLSRHTIHDAFREIQVLLLDTSRLKRRYRLDLEADDHSGEQSRPDDVSAVSSPKLPQAYVALEEKALRLFNKTRKCPARLRWAAFHQGKFEDLLGDVSALNDNMMQFLNSYQLEKHYKMQEGMFMQVLQVNNRIDDLFHLLKSLQEDAAVKPSTSVVYQEHQMIHNQRAMQITRFKAINLSVEAGRSLEGRPGEQDIAMLDLGKLVVGVPLSDEEQPARSLGTYKDTNVWIEWRYYRPVYDGDDSDEERPKAPTSVRRHISKMTQLLCDPELPHEFHIPTCMGSVQDEEQLRLGFVFQSASKEKRSLPTSLFAVLGTVAKPSLTARVRLARQLADSVWYLHSTQWLHKGLRSENVIFSDDREHLTSPALCGFDYSRPADLDETTERPLENPWFDLYRHPKTQFNVPREGRNGFRKLYDVYSLGVVLYEIAVWRPIDNILGLDRKVRLKAAVAKGVRTELLSQHGIAMLESEAGDLFAGIVKFCLSTEAADDQTLQLEFWEKVTMGFDGIAV